MFMIVIIGIDLLASIQRISFLIVLYHLRDSQDFLTSQFNL